LTAGMMPEAFLCDHAQSHDFREAAGRAAAQILIMSIRRSS
jgi:hypothetical protein